MVPQGALVLDNHNGTAPGLIIEKNGKTAILLPGPPNELKPMFEEEVFPYLRKKPAGDHLFTDGKNLFHRRKPGGRGNSGSD